MIDFSSKLPPQAIDLEEFVLGACLLDSKTIIELKNFLHPDCFYKEAHKKIFEAMLTVFNAGDPIDLGTVRYALSKASDLDFIGGPFYLSSLTDRITSSANAIAHARIIQEKYFLREFIRHGSEIVQKGYDDDGDPFDLVEQSNKFVSDILDDVGKGKSLSVSEVAESRLELLRKRSVGYVDGEIKTYLESFDEKITCFEKGECIVIGARPGAGKTTLALQICVENALQGIPTAFLTAEMTVDLVVTKVMFYLANVATYKMRATNHLQKSEFDRLEEASKRLKNIPLFIEGCAGDSINDVKGKWHRLLSKHKIKLFAFDYVQRCGGEKKSDGATERVNQFTMGWNTLCKTTNVPGILISQMNRAVENRGGGKLPTLSDLKDSSALEQEADMVIFPYRPWIQGVKMDELGRSTENLMRLMIAKFRGGEIQDVDLGWSGAYTRVLNEWEHGEKQGEGAKDFTDNPF